MCSTGDVWLGLAVLACLFIVGTYSYMLGVAHTEWRWSEAVMKRKAYEDARRKDY
jgi:hypothetical protein